MNTIYKINEVFQTIQGEGHYTGLPAIFVRLQGCPVGCPWCDTQHTWFINPEREVGLDQVGDVSNESDEWAAINVAQLLAFFSEHGYLAKHVVITGGEPCMYDLNELCEGLHQAGYSTQIETSGTFEVKVPSTTWVTVSPKIAMKGGYEVLASAMRRANEIKHPVAMEKHIEELDALLERVPECKNTPVYLQPISQKTHATKLAIDTCIQRNWRLSAQVHKYLGIE